MFDEHCMGLTIKTFWFSIIIKCSLSERCLLITMTLELSGAIILHDLLEKLHLICAMLSALTGSILMRMMMIVMLLIMFIHRVSHNGRGHQEQNVYRSLQHRQTKMGDQTTNEKPASGMVNKRHSLSAPWMIAIKSEEKRKRWNLSALTHFSWHENTWTKVWEIFQGSR